MFFSGSRYEKAGAYTLTKPDGSQVSVTRMPLPLLNPLAGFHRRLASQQLDLIASHYFADATTFWRLCDGNRAVVPDALGARDLIGIPTRS